MIVDSFLRPDTKKPVAIEYLEDLGVDPVAVKLAVATHWDDDHIGGFAAMMREATAAEFVCSLGLRRQQWFTFAERRQQRTLGGRFSSGVREWIRVIDLLSDAGRAVPNWAIQDKLLRRTGRGEVWALSPSNATVDLGLAGLGIQPEDPAPGIPVCQLTPNSSSVVLRVNAGNAIALLGADLERTDDGTRGWTAVLASAAVKGSKAQTFKVPHHGSGGADEPQVWEDLLVRDPVAPMTRFTKLADPLPTPHDRARISARTARGYIAGRPASRARYTGVVRRMIGAATRSGLDMLTGPVGAVRVRAPRNGQREPTV